MLTILGCWLAVKTALTFISHVSLRVYRKLVSMFTTHHLPGSADVLGYEVSPANASCSGSSKRIARNRSVARTVSPRRRTGGQAMELVSGHECFLALNNRGALSVLDASFTCAWNIEHSGRFYVSSAVVGLCAGLMSASLPMRQKKGSRSRFVSWPRKLVVSQTGRGSREVPSPSVPGRVRSIPSLQMSFLECPSSVENEVSRAGFLEVSLQIWDPSEWRLAAYGGFFREENHIILEARSILHAVRYAESRYPPGRFLILSDKLALVPALCKGRSKWLTLRSVLRRIFASGFTAGCILSFRWIPSDLTYSDKGSRFVD